MKASCNEFKIKGSLLILNLYDLKCQYLNNIHSSSLSIKHKEVRRNQLKVLISKFSSLELELKLFGSDQRIRLLKPMGISDC